MIAWAAAADCAASRPLRATVAPSSERVRAMARPIPAVEPVTRAILPSSESCTVLPPIQRHIAVAGQGTGMVAILGPCCLQDRSEEHTSELQSLMRISYAVFCLKKINIT